MSPAGWTREPPKEPGWYIRSTVLRGAMRMTWVGPRSNNSSTRWRVSWLGVQRPELFWWFRVPELPHPIAPPRDDVVKEDA